MDLVDKPFGTCDESSTKMIKVNQEQISNAHVK